jgi:hypothetical protein
VSLDATTILRSIIRQCLRPDDVTGEVERQLSRLKNSEAAMDIIEALLQHCVGRFSKLYIVIDSLDEFDKEQRTILFRILSSVISYPNSNAMLFLVGRSSVSMDIRKWFPDSQERSADRREAQSDIEAYTRETIALRLSSQEQLDPQEHPDPQEQLILQDSALAQEVIDALIDGADGMYVVPS